MKTIHRNMLLAAIAAIITLGAITPASADYRHDNHGYWDGHHQYHSWVYYHNHRGCWEERNGVRVFISL